MSLGVSPPPAFLYLVSIRSLVCTPPPLLFFLFIYVLRCKPRLGFLFLVCLTSSEYDHSNRSISCLYTFPDCKAPYGFSFSCSYTSPSVSPTPALLFLVFIGPPVWAPLQLFFFLFLYVPLCKPRPFLSLYMSFDASEIIVWQPASFWIPASVAHFWRCLRLVPLSKRFCNTITISI